MKDIRWPNDQMIDDETVGQCMPPEVMQWEGHITFLVVLPK